MQNLKRILGSSLVVILFLTALSGCIQPPESEYDVFSDIVYQNLPDIDQNLISLDVYVPTSNLTHLLQINFQNIKNKSSKPVLNQIKENISSENNKMPVMIWAHGGGWKRGDKANSLDYKIPFFIDNGWILVSVNYRLSPEDIPTDPAELDPNRIKYPIHNQDVAAAVAWVYNNIEEYGGNPHEISLMGHSAGAAIIAAIGTNESFLEEHDLSLDTIRHVICLDTAVYDIRERCETGSMLYFNAFGTDPAVWDDASPMYNIDETDDLSSFLIVTRGTEKRVNLSERFTQALETNGSEAQLLHAEKYTHAQVNQAIGHPNDEIITPVLINFLEMN